MAGLGGIVRNRCLSVTYVILSAVLLMFAGAVQAQWTPGGNSTTTDISRTGKVGVMTTGTPSSQFHVFTATDKDGIAVDGSNNPAINFRSSGSIKGYLGLATAANAFFTGSVANDLILRSEGGKIHIGQGSGAPTMTMSGSNVGLGTTSPGYPLHIKLTNTDPSGGSSQSVNGAYQSASEIDLIIKPSAAQGSDSIREGLVSWLKVDPTSTYAVNEIRGSESDAENYGSGAVNLIRGAMGWAYNASASASVSSIVGSSAYAESDGGTVSSLINLHSWSGVYGGTVTNQYGASVQTGNPGGTVTNQYGAFIGMSGNATNRYALYLRTNGGTFTNDYGIYQEDAISRNYFAGPVSVGGSTGGAYNLNVFGTAAITTGPDELNPRFVVYDDSWNASYVTYGTDTVTRYKSTGPFMWKSVPTQGTRMTAAGTQTMILDQGGNLWAAGQIQAAGAGFVFPDGTIQRTAATSAGTTSVATNVSSGAFGANTGGGNYSFPGAVAIGTATQAGIFNVVGGPNQWAQFTRNGKLMYVNANYSDANQYGYLGMRNGDNMGLALSSSDSHPEYMFINTAGQVGIGTTIPATTLDLGGGTDYTDTNPAWQFYASSAKKLQIRDVNQAVVNLVSDADTAGAVLGTIAFSRSNGQIDAHRNVAAIRAIQTQTGALAGGQLQFFTKPAGTGTTSPTMVIDDTARVGIGLTNPAYTLDVNGTIHATNIIGASYQDVAEWVPAGESLEPGTVVVLDHSHRNQVLASKAAYDTGVAGVVSAQPGIILGTGAPDKAQVATTGRVKVKVDATRAPVRIGDLLVTSDVSGTAMRSVPVEVAGIQMHRPGTIIGKALEPLDSGIGEVLVLLSLQ